jgi:O-antigen ligase
VADTLPATTSKPHWADVLPAICIFGWTLTAPVSITVSQVFIGMSFAAVIIRIPLRRAAPVLHPKMLLISIAGWLLLQIPSVLASPHPTSSWIGFGSSDWLIVLCLAVWWSDPSDRWLLVWCLGLGIASSCAALYALWQHFAGVDLVRAETLTSMGPFFRAQGFFDFYLTFAGVQLAVLMITGTLAMSSSTLKSKHIWILFAVPIALSLWATYGRGAWVGALVALIVAAFLTGGLRRGLWWVGTVACAALVVALVVPESAGRLATVFQLGESGRMALWRGAVRMFAHHPITGVGINQFQEVFPNVYYGQGYLDSFCHAHSDPLNRLAETGIVGIIGAIVLWIVLSWMGWNLWRSRTKDVGVTIGKAAAIGLLALWVAGWSQCYYTDAEVGAVWWFMVGLLALSYRKISADNVTKQAHL